MDAVVNTATPRVIKALHYTPGGRGRWGIPFCLVGDPGTGKSSMVYAFAEQNRIDAEHCVVEIPATADPTDYRGLGVPVDGVIRRMVDEKWQALLDRGVGELVRGIAFFDEFTGAQPAVQTAVMRAILERVLGDRRFSRGVRVCAAMNPPEQVAGSDVLMPLVHRWCTLPWRGDFDAWCHWMTTDGGDDGYYSGKDFVDPEQEEARVEALWPSAYGRWCGTLVAYARARGEKAVHAPPVAGTPESTQPYATYRSMEMAARILAGSEIHGCDDDERGLMLAGAVGHAAAQDIDNAIAELDLPDAEQVLEGAIKFEHDPKRADRTAAVMEACAGVVARSEGEQRFSRAFAFWSLAEEATKVAGLADVVEPAASSILKINLGPTAWRGKDNPAKRVCTRLSVTQDDVRREVKS